MDRFTVRFAALTFHVTLNDSEHVEVRQRQHSTPVRMSPQESAAAALAVREIAELENWPLGIATSRGLGADELPVSVEFGGGAYTFRCEPMGHRRVAAARLERDGETWIEFDQLQHRQFWIALAGHLHNARRRAAARPSPALAGA